MIEDEEFEYNHEQNYNSVINDDDLNAELIALGWEPESVAGPQKKTKTSSAKSSSAVTSMKPSEVSIPIVDINSIGDLDEANMTLTAEDLEDPDLLSQFEELSGKPASSSSTVIQSSYGSAEPDFLNDEPEPSIPAPPIIKTSASTMGNTNMAPPPLPQKAVGPPAPATAAEAKALALKYKREGNDAEALRWFKLAKQLDASVVQTSKSNSGLSVKSAPASSVSTAPTAAASSKAAPARTAASSSSTPKPLPSAVKSLSVPVTPVTSVPPTAPAGISSSSSSAAVIPVGGDAFSPLEEALNEASLITGREAKRLEPIDKRAAVQKFKEYKAYQQELAVLRSRRQAGAQPALFRWQTTQTRKTVENLEIGEDQIRVILEGANDLENVLADHSSRNISVSYTLNIGAKDEETGAGPPAIVTPQAKYESGHVEWNHTNTLSILKRGRHVQQVYARKKAVFELTLHRGFFKSPLVLCQAVIPLNELLTKCEVGGVVPLTAIGAKEGVAVASAATAARKGKAVGGTLRVILRIRSPLLTPEVLITEERTLIVDPWPVLSATTSPSPSVATGVVSVSPVVVASSSGVDITAAETKATSGADPTADNPAFARIPDKEKLDPHSADCIESNDVLEYEIKYSSDLVASGTLDEDEMFSNQLRVQLLQAKMQILVYNVQNELITMEAYLDKLRSRIAADQILAVYFKTLGEKENVGHALRIMKRINIMKEELKNAEEAT